MDLLATAVVVGVLAALAFAIVRALGLEQPWLQPWAILRAVVQLGLLSVVLTGVIEHPLWVAGFLVLMLIAASWNMHRRLRLGGSAIAVFAGIPLVATAVPVSLGVVTLPGAFVGALCGGAAPVGPRRSSSSCSPGCLPPCGHSAARHLALGCAEGRARAAGMSQRAS